MVIDLTPILRDEVKELPFYFKEPADGDLSSVYFQGLDAVPCGEEEIRGKIYDMSAYMGLKLHARFPYKTHCSRCFREMEAVCECDVERVVSNVKKEDDDNIIVYDDRKIDLGETVYEELSMAFPSKPLCRPECKGLCPVCGQDLNEGFCEHTEADN